jgi:predicted DNA-binding protein
LQATNTCANVKHMKRTNFYYPPQMLDRIKALARRLGGSVSEHIRRAISEYLERNKA